MDELAATRDGKGLVGPRMLPSMPKVPMTLRNQDFDQALYSEPPAVQDSRMLEPDDAARADAGHDRTPMFQVSGAVSTVCCDMNVLSWQRVP